MEGTVKWFNGRKRYGFIKGDDGQDYFVHLQAVARGALLKEGDKVTFTPSDSEKGKQAQDVNPTGKTAAVAPAGQAPAPAPKQPAEEPSEEEPEEPPESVGEEPSEDEPPESVGEEPSGEPEGTNEEFSEEDEQ